MKLLPMHGHTMKIYIKKCQSSVITIINIVGDISGGGNISIYISLKCGKFLSKNELNKPNYFTKALNSCQRKTTFGQNQHRSDSD